ncbi:hypothetical protein M2212_006231 [Bradyrhizobium elkanii]|uniref:hypothetical protein n=1 Tax=Bradyrhizobium elkanii TaxID=29448 RepID=UPI00216727AB|nr:hypothetical protein [Bradyrhizobium elkanii]MCS3479385.1 hypothetical protein [Bradyrhizobium elkanii]
MTGDTLRYSPTPTGWKLDAEAGIVAQVGGLFGSDIQVDELPNNTTSVGHRPVGARWLVMVKPAGMREMHGRLLDEAAYSSLSFDPFAALANVVEDDALRWALQDGPQLRNSNSVDELEAATTARRPADLFAADRRDYLVLAYAAFLRGSAAQRAKPYWSALPPGHQPSDYPLCRFAAAGKRQSGDRGVPADPSPAVKLQSSTKPAVREADTSSLVTQAELSALKAEIAAIATNVRDNAGGIALLRAQIATKTPDGSNVVEAAARPLTEAANAALRASDGDAPRRARRETSLIIAGALLVLVVSIGAASLAAIRATDVENASTKAKAEIEQMSKAKLMTLRDASAEAGSAIDTARSGALGDIDRHLSNSVASLKSNAEEHRIQADQQAKKLTTDFEGVATRAAGEIGKKKDEALKDIGNAASPVAGRVAEAIRRIEQSTTAAIACIAAKAVARRGQKVAECEQFADDGVNERQ